MHFNTKDEYISNILKDIYNGDFSEQSIDVYNNISDLFKEKLGFMAAIAGVGDNKLLIDDNIRMIISLYKLEKDDKYITYVYDYFKKDLTLRHLSDALISILKRDDKILNYKLMELLINDLVVKLGEETPYHVQGGTYEIGLKRFHDSIRISPILRIKLKEQIRLNHGINSRWLKLFDYLPTYMKEQYFIENELMSFIDPNDVYCIQKNEDYFNSLMLQLLKSTVYENELFNFCDTSGLSFFDKVVANERLDIIKAVRKIDTNLNYKEMHLSIDLLMDNLYILNYMMSSDIGFDFLELEDRVLEKGDFSLLKLISQRVGGVNELRGTTGMNTQVLAKGFQYNDEALYYILKRLRKPFSNITSNLEKEILYFTTGTKSFHLMLSILNNGDSKLEKSIINEKTILAASLIEGDGEDHPLLKLLDLNINSLHEQLDTEDFLPDLISSLIDCSNLNLLQKVLNILNISPSELSNSDKEYFTSKLDEGLNDWNNFRDSLNS